MDGTLTGVPWSRETVYEDVARRQTEKDAKNQATVHELDGLNRVTKTTDPASKSVVTTYDGVNKVAERDKRGNTTRFAYDDLNRLTKTTDPAPFDTQTVEVTYDDARNRKIEKDRRGILTVTQTDPLGRVVTVTDAATVNASTGAVTGIVLETHVYDGNGNKTSTKDAEGKETRFTYDAANRVASRIDGYGTPEAATLDLRLRQERQPDRGEGPEGRRPRRAVLVAEDLRRPEPSSHREERRGRGHDLRLRRRREQDGGQGRRRTSPPTSPTTSSGSSSASRRLLPRPATPARSRATPTTRTATGSARPTPTPTSWRWSTTASTG